MKNSPSQKLPSKPRKPNKSRNSRKRCPACKGTKVADFGDNFYLPCQVCSPSKLDPRRITVYAIKNVNGEYFCGGKSTKQKNDFNSNLARARLYHRPSIVKAMLTASAKSQGLIAVKITLTVDSEDQIE